MELSNQGKWLLGIIIITLSTILFVLGWTSPFWPPGLGWLGLPIMKTVFPLTVTSLCVLIYFFGLVLLARTDPPPMSIMETEVTDN
ncbi:MAG: hypothetical protein ACFE89_08635 [Candidatus Hodarchaeota archaeon]